MEDGPPLLAAFGNALWDVSVRLKDKKVLSQFGLADDGSKEVTAAEYESIVKAVESYPKHESPGGAALNTLRVFQWLHGRNNASTFFGSVGKDDISKELLEQVSHAGVNGRFKFRSYLTGSVICLIYGHLRSLVAHLGEANFYSNEDLTVEDKRTIERVQLVYIENFFFTHSPHVIWDVVKICKLHGVGIVFNLSGSYLFSAHAANIVSLVKCANVIVGNEIEFLTLSKSWNWGNMEMPQIAGAISKDGVQNPVGMQLEKIEPLSLQSLRSLGKVVVVTQGPKPVLCAYNSKFQFSFPIKQPNIIKDTTGAGDAFVAGLLKGLIDCLDIYDCITLGCYASTEIIQQVGSNPPHHQPLNIANIKEMYTQVIK